MTSEAVLLKRRHLMELKRLRATLIFSCKYDHTREYCGHTYALTADEHRPNDAGCFKSLTSTLCCQQDRFRSAPRFNEVVWPDPCTRALLS